MLQDAHSVLDSNYRDLEMLQIRRGSSRHSVCGDQYCHKLRQRRPGIADGIKPTTHKYPRMIDAFDSLAKKTIHQNCKF